MIGLFFGETIFPKLILQNLKKLNGEFKDNIYVKEIIDFINKDKKRPICTPFSR